MYSCDEISHYAYETPAEFEEAVRTYPFKGGMARDFELDKVLFLPAFKEQRVTMDRKCPLKNAEWQTVEFTGAGRWCLGTFPNGNYNYITVRTT